MCIFNKTKYVSLLSSSAYHWDDWSDELFKPYIRKAMELKLAGKYTTYMHKLKSKDF